MLVTAQKTEANHRPENVNPALFGRDSKAEGKTREPVTLGEIRKAAVRIAPFIRRTPLFYDEGLSARFASNIYLKHELLQKTGAFKVRGAFNKMLTLGAEEKKRGIVAVSGGNHAQAVAFAARSLGCRALILMPEFTPENYIQKTRAYGAAVELFPTMAEAFERAGEYERQGMIYIHPFDDQTVVAGQGTIGLEILEDLPQVTDVIVSIGGGGLAGGISAAVKSLKPDVRIWGAETRGAESMKKALESGRIVELKKITSIAKTLGAPAVAPLTFELAKRHLSDVTVVSDEETVEELFYLLDNNKVLTEPATACTLAAANRLRENFGPANHVVLILCGGNIGLGDLFDLRRKGEKV
ncbi:MAG: threonine/serine dehydratase [Pyrinomonadaceae bacterium]